MKYKFTFCLVCGKEIAEDKEECECGARDFVYGNNLKRIDGGFSCCDNPSLKKTSHMNCNPIYHSLYVCDNCHTIVGTQCYYDNPYFKEES